MVSKKRKTLSQTQKDAILFASDFRCCICRDDKKTTQIHHLDENPENNDFTNLAVLCLEHHDEATAKGGLGCRLSQGLIKRYRDNWLEIVSAGRSKRIQPHLPVALSESDIHCAFLDALACHEIIKQEHRILQVDWKEKVPLLDDLYIYTSYDYGIPPKAKMMDLLYTLATKTRMGMPEKVAKTIEHLALNSLPVNSLVMPAHKTPSEQQIHVLTSANYVGYTMTYDGIKSLQNIKIVASGAEIMSAVLRYAKLNDVDVLYKLVIDDFNSAINLSVEKNFQDAKKWLVFMQADALALDGDVLPALPSDVHRKLMS